MESVEKRLKESHRLLSGAACRILTALWKRRVKPANLRIAHQELLDAADLLLPLISGAEEGR